MYLVFNLLRWSLIGFLGFLSCKSPDQPVPFSPINHSNSAQVEWIEEEVVSDLIRTVEEEKNPDKLFMKLVRIKNCLIERGSLIKENRDIIKAVKELHVAGLELQITRLEHRTMKQVNRYARLANVYNKKRAELAHVEIWKFLLPEEIPIIPPFPEN